MQLNHIIVIKSSLFIGRGKKIVTNFIYLFIYLIFGSAGPALLHWLFSSCGEQGLLSSCSARASLVFEATREAWQT